MSGKDIENLIKEQGLRIELGYGIPHQTTKGFVSMDSLAGADIVQDIDIFPWDLPDECASIVIASHIFQRINPANKGFIRCIDEIWRILKPEGELMLSVPYAGSYAYYQDPTSCNPCNESTWAYFDPFAKGGLYTLYKPKPWKVEKCVFSVNGNMEVLMSKRLIDQSYGN